MAARRDIFLPALLLALVSGAAGLAHQLVWTRRLVDVLGANADTFSKVLGAFFVGLAFGAWLASRAKCPASNYWRRVALAEVAVALLAVPALFSANLAVWVYEATAPGPLLKLLLPLFLATPPATAMGLVMPWMIRALAGDATFAPKQSLWLYGVNTLGGVLGIGGALLFALPAWGLFGASLGAMGLNLLVATGAFWMSPAGRRKASAGGPAESGDHEVNHGGHKSGVTRRLPPQAKPLPAPPTAAAGSAAAANGVAGMLAFASGFLVLAAEVVLQKQVAQVAINSLFSSAIVLAMVLVSLGLAALFTPMLVSRVANTDRALGLALGAAALLSATQPFLFTQMREGISLLAYELTPAAYVEEVLKLGGIAICPLLVAGGFVFPLLLRNVVAEKPENCRRVGVLLAWNGIGGWLGAESAESLIAPHLGLWRSMGLLGGGYAALFLICNSRPKRPHPSRSPSGGEWVADRRGEATSPGACLLRASGLGVSVLIAGWFAGQLPETTLNPGERLAALRVGREGVVATVECGRGDWRMLFNNSYTLGGSKAQFNQERQGLLPLLLHGHPKSVGVLGVATGGTTAGVALHPGVERVHAIELSPLVLQQAKEFFGPYNRNVFGNSRVRFQQEDARWVIAHQRGAYDVVVGDLFLPWRTGEGRLFTREHFQNVRAALKPGGLFCQWLPLFQLTRPQFDTIARTFTDIFPDAFLVRGDFYCDLPILGLIGGRAFAKVDWGQVEAGCTSLQAEGEATDPLIRHPEGVAMMMLGPLPDPGIGPVNTLADAGLEWDAGRNIVGLRAPWFLGIPCAEYVREVQRAGNSALPERFRRAQEAGQFFLTLEIAAKINLPARTELESQIPRQLPLALREDSFAQWHQWPSRVKPEIQPANAPANVP